MPWGTWNRLIQTQRTACAMCSCILHKDVCHQFQPYTWTQTNPTPSLTQTRTLSPTLWGARGRQGQSRGSAALCFGGVIPKNAGRPKDPHSDQLDPHPAKCFGQGAAAHKSRQKHRVFLRKRLAIFYLFLEGLWLVGRNFDA